MQLNNNDRVRNECVGWKINQRWKESAFTAAVPPIQGLSYTQVSIVRSGWEGGKLYSLFESLPVLFDDHCCTCTPPAPPPLHRMVQKKATLLFIARLVVIHKLQGRIGRDNDWRASFFNRVSMGGGENILVISGGGGGRAGAIGVGQRPPESKGRSSPRQSVVM